MTSKQIIQLLPYQKPFLFVDELTNLEEEGITGNYTFRKDEYFYTLPLLLQIGRFV